MFAMGLGHRGPKSTFHCPLRSTHWLSRRWQGKCEQDTPHRNLRKLMPLPTRKPIGSMGRAAPTPRTLIVRSLVTPVQRGRNGFNTCAPRPATSPSLRVTSVSRLTAAVAAKRQSMTGVGLRALILPHRWATALSIPSTRPSNATSTWPSHRSSAAALSGSRMRASSTPLRISPRTSVLRNTSASAIEAYQSLTCGSHLSPLQTSEMTLVSSR